MIPAMGDGFQYTEIPMDAVGFGGQVHSFALGGVRSSRCCKSQLLLQSTSTLCVMPASQSSHNLLEIRLYFEFWNCGMDLPL